MSRFCKNIENVTICIETNTELLCKNIKKYYDTNLKSIDQQIFKADIDIVLDFAKQNKYKIQISSSLFKIAIKNKISKYLGNIIDMRSRIMSCSEH